MVLTIIALIVVSIMASQSMIRQAKIRSVVSEYNRLNVSVNVFRIEYNSMPGDFDKAVEFAIGGNGNGNKIVHDVNTENLEFWQHLSLSGNLREPYEGGGPPIDPGRNIPRSKFGSKVVVHIGHIGSGDGNCLGTSGNSLFGTVRNAHVFSFGIPDGSAVNCPYLPFLKASEAHNVDVKMDDGNPSRGGMLSANMSDTNNVGNRCVDNSTDGTGGAEYDLTSKEETCRVLFKFVPM